MMPTLAPGDRLVVVVPRGPDVRPAAGDLVVTADPRLRSRALVKRVGAIDATTVELVGDNAAASTDSRAFGRVPIASLQGRVVYRYAPAGRVGPLGRRRRPRPAGTIAGAWRSPG